MADSTKTVITVARTQSMQGPELLVNNVALAPAVLHTCVRLMQDGHAEIAANLIRFALGCALREGRDVVDFIGDALVNKTRNYEVIDPIDVAGLPGPLQMVHNSRALFKEADHD